MKTQASVKDLLVSVRDYVEQQGYSKGTQNLYIAGINSMRRRFEHERQEVYSHHLAWEYVLERRKLYEDGEIAYDTFLYTWKVAEILEEYFNTSKIKRRKSNIWSFEHICPAYEALLTKYESEKLEQGYSTNTIRGECSAIRMFFRYLENKGVPEISKIKRSDISEYIPILSKENPAGISGILS